MRGFLEAAVTNPVSHFGAFSSREPVSTSLENASANQARVEVGIDIAAGQHDHDRLALGVDATRKQSCKADRPARLDHELEFAEGKGDGAAYLGDRKSVV